MSITMEVESVSRMTRDIRKAAATLDDAQARHFVDAYYAMQDARIRSDGQVRSLNSGGEPHSAIEWFAAQNRLMEEQVKGILDRYTSAHPVGQWMKNEVKGIGPVLAACLLAHIDITRCPTAGHIMNYAGLNPDIVWHSSEYIRGREAALRKEHDEWTAFLDACAELKKKPLAVLRATEHIDAVPTPEDAIAICHKLMGIKFKPKAVFHADNILHELVPKERLSEAYIALVGDIKLDWKEIIRVLTKRPWNAELKKRLWLLGESFCKTSGGDEPGYYGKIYKDKKEKEVALNAKGALAEQAKMALEKKNYRADTVAKKHYMAGTLPPAHVHARAKRFAVKRFLHDLHTVWYWTHYKKLPPLPYVIEHLGHAHYEVSGAFNSVPGLVAALEKRSPIVKKEWK